MCGADGVGLATAATAVRCAQSSSKVAKARTALISHTLAGEVMLADPVPTSGRFWHRP